MHLIIIAIILIAFVVLYFSSQANRYQRKSEENFIQPTTDSLSGNQKFVYISKGKLFLWKDGKQIEEIHSRYIQGMIDRLNRKKELHGWKENTSLGTSFTGQPDNLAVDQVELQFVSAQFVSESKLIYFLKDSRMGGLFEYDLTDKTERRLLHKQNLFYENLAVNKASKKILCAQQYENGTANIVMLSKEGDDDRQHPAWPRQTGCCRDF